MGGGMIAATEGHAVRNQQPWPQGSIAFRCRFVDDFESSSDAGWRSRSRVDPLALPNLPDLTSPKPLQRDRFVPTFCVDGEQHPNTPRTFRQSPRSAVRRLQSCDPEVLLTRGDPASPGPNGAVGRLVTAPAHPATGWDEGWPWSKRNYPARSATRSSGPSPRRTGQGPNIGDRPPGSHD